MEYQPMRTRAASFDEVDSLHTISEAAESLILMIAMVDIQRWFEAARGCTPTYISMTTLEVHSLTVIGMTKKLFKS